MTGATSGEFTVWDGRNFYWESVLQVRRGGGAVGLQCKHLNLPGGAAGAAGVAM